jgi:RNA polymerase sigma-70 factor (ECF subfamily)
VAQNWIDDLYRTHGFMVFRRCRQLLRDDEEAWDTMQETFLKTLESQDDFRGESRRTTWLFGIASNLCLRRIRNRAARDGAWEENVACEIEREQGGPHDRLEARRIANALLGRADEETAMIALYHFVDGLSQGEIAKLVGRSRVTVNQKLQRFRREARLTAGTW